jgi:glycosyltransferase involved in cell wall biosynthesis
MRLHLLSLPHTETTEDYSWCAFTSLVRNMATMMTREGHEVLLYAGPNNTAECAEHIICSDQPATCDPFVPPWTYEYFESMNNRIISAMRERIEPGDFILQSTSLQSIVGEAFPRNISVEYAIGYGGCRAACRVFPSEAWRHEIYGRDAAARGEDIHTVTGWASDCVIPHMLDFDQFPTQALIEPGDYILFVGRLNSMKGEEVAVEVAKRTGLPLKIVGSGTPPGYGEYLGIVRPKERAELMSNARICMFPSIFPEPFGLVAIEAQACGTPVLTTDWGAFTETVQNGVSGYRCSTINEFVQAVTDCRQLDRWAIVERAMRLYSFEAVGPQYTKFFVRLQEIMNV